MQGCRLTGHEQQGCGSLQSLLRSQADGQLGEDTMATEDQRHGRTGERDSTAKVSVEPEFPKGLCGIKTRASMAFFQSYRSETGEVKGKKYETEVAGKHRGKPRRISRISRKGRRKLASTLVIRARGYSKIRSTNAQRWMLSKHATH